MRILFVLNSLGFLRHFDRTLVELSRRGHRIVLAITDRGDTRRELPIALKRVKGLRVVNAPFQRGPALREPVRTLRSLRDYVRYHEPPCERQAGYRARALERFLQVVSGDTRSFDAADRTWFAGLTPVEVERIRRSFQAIEDLVPSDPIYERFIQSETPDAVLVTPLITFASPLVDLVKAARKLSIPVGFPVFSWDNLSTKGVVHVAPDRLFVWNDVQRREAVELHGIDSATIVVTGAPRFDEFFDGRPSESRDALCARLGFDPSRPIVTYLGSSPFVSPDEPEFVDSWVAHLRSATDVVKGANILVRPHPRAESRWKEWEAPQSSGVGVYSTSKLGDQALYDCIHHADAVVALNTSAQLEAGILGKPVLTVLSTTYAPGQEGSMHFDYLLAEQGGHVQVAGDLGEHVRQLEGILTAGFDAERCRRFIQAFLRPAGLDRPASPILADAIERLAADAETKRRRLPARLSKWRQRLGAVVAGGDIADDAAVSAVVRSRVRREQRRIKQWKQRVDQLTAELGGLRGSEVRDVDYPHAKVQIVVTSRAERQWRAHMCAKEPWTTNWIDEYVKPGQVVYDIGANVGVFSLIAAKRLEGEGLVVAFEPGYANFARLCENVVLNQVESLVVPVPVPLSDSNGLQAFTYHSREPGQSRHRFIGAEWTPGDASATRRYSQPVLGMRLDDLVPQFALPRPMHVKLDVDGAEVQVIRGATRTLGDPSVRTLMIEVDVKLEDEVVPMLREVGLLLKARYERPVEGQRLKTWYGLFARASSA